MKPHAGPRSSKKVANSLVALSSAAILTVYSAGYARTKSSADRFAAGDARRPVVPSPSSEIGPLPAPQAAAAVAATDSAAPIRTRPAGTTANEPRGAAPKAERRPESNASLSLPSTAAAIAHATPAATGASALVTLPPAPLPIDTKSAEAVAALTPAPPQPQYKDGTYYGWGTSRHGDIQAYVVIESGHIVAAAIAQCLTRYSCSWIAHLPGQVIIRQSADVDYVTGATQSTNAFYYAVVEALAKAK